MAVITTSREEPKPSPATPNDPIDTQGRKPSVKVKKEADASTANTNESSFGKDEPIKRTSGISITTTASNVTSVHGSAIAQQIPAETVEQTSNDQIIVSTLSNLKQNSQIQIDPSTIVQTPNVNDVVLGRGKPYQNHVGNQSMLRIVDMYRKRYHESERAFKHEIIEHVLDIIKSRGGRFLERIFECDQSVWNQVPHRMAYRKVGHAFRSNARRISMEKRDKAKNQQRNASANARVSMISQFMVGNEDMLQRLPLQAAAMSEKKQGGGRFGLTGAMGIGGSIFNDSAGVAPDMFHQGGGPVLNHTQRELMAERQMLHFSGMKPILVSDGNNIDRVGAVPSQCFHSVQSMLGLGDSLSLAGNMTGNLAGNSLQLNYIRRMMLLGSAGVSNHPNSYSYANLAAASRNRFPNISLPDIGNFGDCSLK